MLIYISLPLEGFLILTDDREKTKWLPFFVGALIWRLKLPEERRSLFPFPGFLIKHIEMSPKFSQLPLLLPFINYSSNFAAPQKNTMIKSLKSYDSTLTVLEPLMTIMNLKIIEIYLTPFNSTKAFLELVSKNPTIEDMILWDISRVDTFEDHSHICLSNLKRLTMKMSSLYEIVSILSVPQLNYLEFDHDAGLHSLIIDQRITGKWGNFFQKIHNLITIYLCFSRGSDLQLISIIHQNTKVKNIYLSYYHKPLTRMLETVNFSLPSSCEYLSILDNGMTSEETSLLFKDSNLKQLKLWGAATQPYIFRSIPQVNNLSVLILKGFDALNFNFSELFDGKLSVNIFLSKEIKILFVFTDEERISYFPLHVCLST